MIHCMVKRRLAPGHTRLQLSNEAISSSRKWSLPQYADSDLQSSAIGVLEFAKVHGAEKDCCSSQRRSSCSANSETSRAEGASQQVHESPGRDEHNSRIEEETSLTGPAQKLCVEGTKKLSPYRRVSDVRGARRASLHRTFERRNFSKDRDSSEKFAYMSLDGRLMNAEMATSSTTIGGGLLDNEARAWDEFDPLQRVLIVAVSAAAAAAGKRQRMAEFCRLRNILNARERELEVMRQKLSNLCNQETLKKSKTVVALAGLEESVVASTEEQARNRLCTKFSALGMAGDVDGACLDEPEAVVIDDSEAKWYCNPMLQTGEHYFQMCTPEIDDPLFRNCTTSSQETSGWRSMQRDAGLLCKPSSLLGNPPAKESNCSGLEIAKSHDNHMLEEPTESNYGVLIPTLRMKLQTTFGSSSITGGTAPAVPEDQHLSDASKGEKVSAGRLAASTVEGAEKIHLPHHGKRSRLGFPEDSTEYVAEQLLGELERAAEKVVDMESQIKALKHYATESNANWKNSEVKLEEWIDSDCENQVIAHMEITELRRQLHRQESEFKSLEGSCKVMLAVKSKEIAQLREDCQRRDAALDDITAAARATRAASDERIGVLEDLCRRKDTVIFDLKQDIVALESKVRGLRTFQSPAMLCARRSFTCLPTHQSDEGRAASLPLPVSPLHKDPPRRFPCYLSPPTESAQGHSNIGESQKDCLSGSGDCSSLTLLPSHEDYTAAEKPVQAYCIDQESSKDFFSPPPSTVGDDCQELESSLLALSVDEERKMGSGQCTSSQRYRDIPIPPTEEFRVIKESDFNNHDLPRHKKQSPGAFTDIFSVQANAAASIIVDESFTRASCSSSSTGMVSSGKKAKREPFCSPQKSVESFGSVTTNTHYEPRRAASVDLSSSGFKSLARNGLKENIKQRRWQ